MSAIRQALYRLDDAISRLDSNVQGLEQSLTGQQRDMFSMPAPKAAPSLSLQDSVIAQRLDKAIEKVEELLKE